MQKIVFFILFISGIISLAVASGQEIQQIKIPGLEKILKHTDNRLYVINFWATWCGPCVKELPAFEKVAGEYDQSKVRFIMISLDFPSQVETHLKPFLKKNNISLDVILMAETDYNLWIDKVDPQWQGNLPATLFINNAEKTRYFHPGEIREPELKILIDKYL